MPIVSEHGLEQIRTYSFWKGFEWGLGYLLTEEQRAEAAVVIFLWWATHGA